MDKLLPKSTKNRSDVLEAILGRERREHRGAKCKIFEESLVFEVFKIGKKSVKVSSARRFSRYLKRRILSVVSGIFPLEKWKMTY